jgi:uncharacterized protein
VLNPTLRAAAALPRLRKSTASPIRNGAYLIFSKEKECMAMPHKQQETKEAPGKSQGKMTVEEAGHKGGQRVKELVEEGKETEQKKEGRGSGTEKGHSK